MKAIPFLKKSGAEDLRVMDWPDPVVSADEVLIDVRAFGLNYADLMARNGEYPDAPKFPFVPGYEVAGVVKEVGSSVSHLKKGARVLALTSFGGYASLAKTKAQGVLKIPQHLSFEEAASIPVNFATAYHAIHNTGAVVRGSRILIHAAAGGVGMAAVQLAKLAGLEIFGTAGSDQKLKLLSEMGVQHPINYREKDFAREVLTITGRQGIDIILDSIGGSTLKKDLSILRANGRVAAFGVASLSNRSLSSVFTAVPNVVSMLTLNGIQLLSNSLGFYGINMKRLGDENPELLASIMESVMKLFQNKSLHTNVSQVFSWNEIGRAQTMLQSRASTGKFVLRVD